jgi:hypothetical protein
MMKSNSDPLKATKIKLSKTFFNIATGQITASEVAARKRAARDAEKAEALLKGRRLDRTDPFIGNFGR